MANFEIRTIKNFIVDKFIKELQEFTCTGKYLTSAGQDLNYSLELQRKRLESKNLDMRYEIVPKGSFAESSGSRRIWTDNRYVSQMEYRTCELTKTFSRNDEKLFQRKKDYYFYEIITDVKDNDVVAHDTYTCPNCGAISQIGDLQKGCSYCGTFFKMTDLFPKVTNFCLMQDDYSKDRLNGDLKKWMVACGVVIYISNLLRSLVEGTFEIGILIWGILGAALGGVFFGYFFYSIISLVGVFVKAGKSVPTLLNIAGSEKTFETKMKKHSPEFSYQYFSDKVVSIMKMILFSESPENLPYYVGEPIVNTFSDIVDSTFTGSVALKKFKVEEEFCNVTVDVYTENVLDVGNRLRRKEEVFRVVLRKNVRTPIDMQFSIKKIQCKGCGASFDATKQRNCPTCGRVYEIGDDDWVVISIKRL